MDNLEPHAERAQVHLPEPVVVRWRRARACYTYANLATHHVLGFAVKTALLVYFAFGILLLVLRYLVLPHIDVYKPDIEKLAGKALGNRVTIARIYASWDGLRPALFLGDVALHDPQGRQVLALPSVAATLSWWSVAAREARFESLEIIRPQLDVRRDASGALFVAGVRIDPGKQGDGSGADWLLRQREIVIRDGRVVWTDARRGAAPLALAGVALVLQNQWNRHRFALHATPPGALAQPLDVRANFTHPPFAHHPSDPTMWRGEVYADLRNTDLAAWKPYVDYPFPVAQGKGSVRAWLTVDQARLVRFTADVGLAGVAARLAPDLPPLALARVTGRIAGRAEPRAGHAVTLTNFAVTTGAGLQLPATTLTATFVPASAGQREQGSVTASTLDLAALAELAAQLPLTSNQRALLADFAPRGTVNDLALSWHGRYPAAQATFKIKAAVAGLRLGAQPAHPAVAATATSPAHAARPALGGVDNLSGAFEATEQGGSVAIASDKLMLHLAPWFADDAFPLDKLAVRARWSFPNQHLQVDIDQAEARQGKLVASVTGRHVLSGGPGVTDLNATVDGFDIAQIGRFLPLATHEHLRDWLTGALVGGSVHDAKLRLRGDLAHFPFRADTPDEKARGEFYVFGRIQDGKLNYTPGHYADGSDTAPLWPLAEHINGTIVFDRTRMEIDAATASTGNVALNKVKAVVPDLASHDMQLEIDGAASGALQEFLKYMEASPVLAWIGHFTEETKATGNASLALSLRLPLTRLHESGVNGALQLQGNDIALLPDLPLMQATLGTIGFNEHGVALTGLGASFLGGPLAVSGGSEPDGAILIKLGGTMTVDGLRKAYPAPAMQRVADHIAGSTHYTGLVEVRNHLSTVTVDTTLAGLGLTFPAPLAKAAPDALPLHFVLTGKPASDQGVARDDIDVALGKNMAAHYEREKPVRGAWGVKRGGIGVNVPAPLPEDGMTISVNTKSLNVDPWLALGADVASAGAGSATGGVGGSMAQYFIPTAIAARATQLQVGGRTLNDVVLGASHLQDDWQANIDSRQVSGHVTWSEQAGQAMGKVTARLSALTIPESSAAEVKELLESDRSAAANIPALDIIAERFELFNKQLGRLELVASNAKALAGREWRIEKLALANPDGVLKASGRWVTRDGKSNTGMNFDLDILDGGRLLARLGFPGTLSGGKGKLNGDIGWAGLPYALDIPSLSGQIDLNVGNGQFLKQDPGAAKLLGVLSLQALPRLLKLDFHDVFSEGLAFDGITANAIITRGVVATRNLKMHGLAATVLMDGTADIANESTNLHVVVIPEFNLGTGPLVYGLAINPVIGLGSFLAQWVLRAPVMKALTYQMVVAGPWKAPVVTKLDAKPEVPVRTRVN